MLLVTGCAATPRPWTPPKATWRAQPLGAAAPTTQGVRLVASLHAVEQAPTGSNLEAEFAGITALQGQPFRVSGPFAGWLRLPADLDVAAAATAAGARHRVLDGAYQCLLADGGGAVLSAACPGLPAIELRLVGDRIDVALLADDGERTASLRATLANPLDGAAAWYFPATDGSHGGFVAIVRAVAHTAPAEALATSLPSPPVSAPDLLGTQVALLARSFGAQNRRGALLALASRSGDPALIDAIVTAQEIELVAAAERVAAEPTWQETTAPWQLARAVWSVLAQAAQRGDLSLGTQACLVRHVGSLAHEPLGLEGALLSSGSIAEFHAAVRDANSLALQDLAAPSRVHAHDWLAARGWAVPDYDPLADESSRRAALRAHAAKLATEGGPR